MAGVERGVTGETEQAERPSALRIDVDVFATLSERPDETGEDVPAIVGWFDCWRR